MNYKAPSNWDAHPSWNVHPGIVGRSMSDAKEVKLGLHPYWMYLPEGSKNHVHPFPFSCRS